MNKSFTTFVDCPKCRCTNRVKVTTRERGDNVVTQTHKCTNCGHCPGIKEIRDYIVKETEVKQ